MSIRVLPTQLINKIAAGEVIERPSSIVKELVENSLDAGATRIDVAVENGGMRLISVTDDGAGMSPDDLKLAFVPHATSKIAAEDDLFAIDTMGFRGEALASIAGVSHAHIRSCAAGGEGGFEIDAASADARPCPAAQGATVTVRDLFYNIPARRKFMRTANTEFGHVHEQLIRLALPQPRVAFTLIHNGRKTMNLPVVESTAMRAIDLFGRELAGNLISVSPRRATVAIDGLIAPPSAARASGKWQYFFLNGRYIRDRLLSHALKEAYRGLIDQSRWPVALVFIRISPSEVDVNVHPTKIEVRFRDSQLIHGELLAALKETLNKANISPSVAMAAPADFAGGDEAPPSDRRDSIRQALADFFKTAPPPQPRLSFPETYRPQRDHAEDADEPARANLFAAAADRPRSVQPAQEAPATAEDPRKRPLKTVPAGPCPVQIHSSYIVAQVSDGLVIIDQHALHEKVIYNDLKRRLESGPLTGQRLLIPEVLETAPAESDALMAQTPLLAKLGIELACFGPASIAVQQFPSMLIQRGHSAADFVRQLADRISETGTATPEQLLEDMLQTLACKAAVKAGDALTHEEMAALVSEYASDATHCPHGRPAALKLTLADLQKQFKRT